MYSCVGDSSNVPDSALVVDMTALDHLVGTIKKTRSVLVTTYSLCTSASDELPELADLALSVNSKDTSVEHVLIGGMATTLLYATLSAEKTRMYAVATNVG